MTNEKRDHVFISYAHEDTNFAKLLIDKVKAEADSSAIIWWDREKIKPGQLFDEEIGRAINSSRVALLLVSEHFQNSQYVRDHEFPRLIAAHRRNELDILWGPVRMVTGEGLGLDKYQAAWSVDRPLIRLHPRERDVLVFKAAREINRRFGPGRSLGGQEALFERRVGEVVARHGFTLGEKIASGDLSIVYRATFDNETYAVKAFFDMPARRLSMDMVERRLRRMGNVGGSFIRIDRIWLREEPPCIVTELVNSRTLGERLRSGPLEPERAILIIQRLASELARFHQQGGGELLYGSLRPTELYGDEAATLRLSTTDFSTELLESERKHGNVVMTPEMPTYMVPEQYYGKPFTLQTDQYSLALLALELLDGHAPVRVHDPWQLEQKRAFFDDQCRYFMPSDTAPKQWCRAYPALARTLSKMLSKEPDDRFASMAEAAEQLAEPRVNRTLIGELRSEYPRFRDSEPGQQSMLFYDRFYKTLFAMQPQLEPHFHDHDWSRLYQMLDNAIMELLDLALKGASPLPTLKKKLDVHHRLRLTAAEVDAFFDAFLLTLKHVSGSSQLVLPTMEDMWTVALRQGRAFAIEYLTGGSAGTPDMPC